MARPVTIQNEEILRAAHAVFVEQGVNAKTADIARRAGVSEGTLFHRFKTKEALFHAAMVEVGAEDAIRRLDLEARVGRGELFAELTSLGTQIVELFRILVPGAMMLRACGETSEKTGLPEPLRRKNSPPVQHLRALARYFEGEMRAGRIRSCDSEVIARTFMGALWQYAFFELLAIEHAEPPLPQAMYVRGLVDLLLNGLTPPRPRAEGGRRLR